VKIVFLEKEHVVLLYNNPIGSLYFVCTQKNINVLTFDSCNIGSFLRTEGGKQAMCTLVIHSFPLYLHLI
jgi:hypothetical protein